MKWSVLLLLAIGVVPAHIGLSDTPTGYVILTTTNIVAQSTELTNFVAAKEARGFEVQVIQNTSSNQGGWCGNTNGATGDPAAELLRSWLVAHYTNGTQRVIDYVLLIGNPNPTNGDIPMKMCRPFGWGSTDYYYSDLSGNWDINTNGIYGEWADFLINGGPDITSEVIVGRIPYYGSISNLDKILRHTIDYENALAGQSAWRNMALLPASPVPYFGYCFYQGYEFAEYLRTDKLIPSEWAYHRVYDADHGLTNPVPETIPCAYSNVAVAWSSSRPGAVFWFQDGGATYARDFMDVDHVSQISSNGAFVFAGSCFNGQPETTNNLAHSLLLNGAVGSLAASGYTWWYPLGAPPWLHGQSVPHMIDGCVLRFVGQGLPIGDTVADYRTEGVGQDTGWQNFLFLNVYGCPAIGIRSARFSGPILSF